MNRYIIRKQRIAPGYMHRMEIVEEDYFHTNETDLQEIIAHDVPDSYLTLAPGEQLIIHNAGDS